MEKEQHTPLWNALMIFAMVLGGIVAVVAIYRNDLLPSLYAGNSHPQELIAHAEHEPTTSEDSAIHEGQAQDLVDSKSAIGSIEQDHAQSVTGKYLLIAGSFTLAENATRYKQQLETNEIQASISTVQDGSHSLHRVIVASSDSWNEIRDAKERLVSKGWRECWVFQQR